MFRAYNVVEIKYNKTYKRAMLKCTLKTETCMALHGDSACNLATKLGYYALQRELQKIDRNYGLAIVSTKYSTNKKYKHRGIIVTDYSSTVIFKITYNREVLGDVMMEGLIAKLTQNKYYLELPIK